MRNFLDKVAEKIKTHTSLRKSCRLRGNVEKYGRDRQATDDNILWCMGFACPIAKATEKHSYI